MLSYVIKKILLLIPTLLVLSMLIFLLAQLSPVDRAETRLTLEGINPEDSAEYQRYYNDMRIKLGLDAPSFYCSVLPSTIAGLLDDVSLGPVLQQELLQKEYDQVTIKKLMHTKNVIKERLSPSAYDDYNMERIVDVEEVNYVIGDAGLDIPLLVPRKVRFYYPIIRWNGTDNQYHRWISKLIKGNLGVSNRDGRPVGSKISSGLRWTVWMVVITYLIGIFIAIPLSLLVSQYGGVKVNRIYDFITTSIYSIPIFWLATLLLIATGTGGSLYSADNSPVDIIFAMFNRFWPAILCLVFSDLAIINLLLKRNLEREAKLAYSTTAKAKGLKGWDILRGHNFFNASIPLVTAIVMSIPVAFAGTLILEVVFNIPGMGRLLYTSLTNGDWDVVFVIILLLGILVNIFFILGDVLLALIDPKVELA